MYTPSPRRYRMYSQDIGNAYLTSFPSVHITSIISYDILLIPIFGNFKIWYVGRKILKQFMLE